MHMNAPIWVEMIYYIDIYIYIYIDYIEACAFDIDPKLFEPL